LKKLSEDSNQNLLLTGASGFLGKVFYEELKDNYSVTTLSRSGGSDIKCDLSLTIPEIDRKIDCVLHNAGKAHTIPKTTEERDNFFKVNELGTLNLLKGLDRLNEKPGSFVFISTVAVYGLEQGEDIKETAPLLGATPYALSKIKAEKHVREWCEKNKVNCSILRLPLVAGKNAPGNLSTIRNAISKGYYFSIKGNDARKSMVLAKDIAKLIPLLLDKNGIYNLTDGHHPKFTEIEKAIAASLGKSIPFLLPYNFVKLLSGIGDLFSKLGLPTPLTRARFIKMTSSLTFNDDKAKRELNWKPDPVLKLMKTNYQY
jgi:nucleoside-diphosphate-sugar epimerase